MPFAAITSEPKLEFSPAGSMSAKKVAESWDDLPLCVPTAATGPVQHAAIRCACSWLAGFTALRFLGLLLVVPAGLTR